METPLPIETDYPEETFRPDLAPEYRVGCANAYFKANFLARRLFRERVDIAFDLMPSGSCDRALDAGTGAGFLLPGLAARCRKVDGVDLSPVLRYTKAMLDKRALDNVKLVEADLLHLPYDGPIFDLAVCLSVIEHIPEPEAALKELARVLHDDAVLILGYPLENAFFISLEWMIRIESRLRLRIQGKALPRGKAFRPHVTDCRGLEKTVEKVFTLEARRDIRIVGLPVYRILKLRKTTTKGLTRVASDVRNKCFDNRPNTISRTAITWSAIKTRAGSQPKRRSGFGIPRSTKMDVGPLIEAIRDRGNIGRWRRAGSESG